MRKCHTIALALCCTLLLVVVAACSVSYKFNGASIDYTKTKTIQINDFPIRACKPCSTTV